MACALPNRRGREWRDPRGWVAVMWTRYGWCDAGDGLANALEGSYRHSPYLAAREAGERLFTLGQMLAEYVGFVYARADLRPVGEKA